MAFVQLIWYFSFYSLIGWIWETGYLSITNKKFVDTGFLKGPFCPLYGFSAITIILLLSRFQSNIFLFFPLAILIATLFEYLTSIFIELFFKIKFWDYSKFKFNFQGRIALIVSLTWGLLSTILIRIIHPFVILNINKISVSILVFGSMILIAYFLIDILHSAISLVGLKNILKRIDHLPLNITEFRRYQIRFFKAFPQISSKKFNLVKKISQKINNKNAIIQ